jgi:copper chaperone
MKRETLSVTGMSCNDCEQNVENALKNLDGVTRVTADHEGNTVEVVVEDDLPDKDIHTIIEKAGYDVTA